MTGRSPITLFAVIAAFVCIFASSADAACYSGVCAPTAAKAAPSVQRLAQDEQHDMHSLAVAGVWWGLAGLLVAIGYASRTYFTVLSDNNGFCSFTSLVAWVMSIWAVLTVLFVGISLILAFTLEGRNLHVLVVSGIWIAFFAFLWAQGLVAAGFIDAIQTVTGNCNTVIASYWTALGIFAIQFIFGALWIAYSL